MVKGKKVKEKKKKKPTRQFKMAATCGRQVWERSQAAAVVTVIHVQAEAKLSNSTSQVMGVRKQPQQWQQWQQRSSGSSEDLSSERAVVPRHTGSRITAGSKQQVAELINRSECWWEKRKEKSKRDSPGASGEMAERKRATSICMSLLKKCWAHQSSTANEMCRYKWEEYITIGCLKCPSKTKPNQFILNQNTVCLWEAVSNHLCITFPFPSLPSKSCYLHQWLFLLLLFLYFLASHGYVSHPIATGPGKPNTDWY